MAVVLFYLNQEEEYIPETVEETPFKIEIKEEKPKPIIRKRTIADLLKEEPDVVLLEENETINNPWKGAWDQYLYKSSTKDVSDVWKNLSDKDIRSPEAPKSFKQMCKSNSSKEIESKEEKLYQEVKTFCTKDKKT